MGACRGNSATFYLSENGGLTEELVVSVLLTSLAVPKCVARLRSGLRYSSRVPAGPARVLRPRLPAAALATPHFVIRPFSGSAGAGVRRRDGLAQLDPAGLVYYGR